MGAGMGLVLIVGLWSTWSTYQKGQDRQSLILVHRALAEVEEAAQLQLLQKAVAEHPRGSGAGFARLLLARMAFTKQEYDKVDHWLQPVTQLGDRQALLRILALHNLATAHEAKGDWTQAVHYYQQAVADPHNVPKDLSYYHLGRAYEHTEQWDQARYYYEKVRKESKNSQLKENTLRRLIWLARDSATS